jgi:hypothetical protein
MPKKTFYDKSYRLNLAAEDLRRLDRRLALRRDDADQTRERAEAST